MSGIQIDDERIDATSKSLKREAGEIESPRIVAPPGEVSQMDWAMGDARDVLSEAAQTTASVINTFSGALVESAESYREHDGKIRGAIP